MTGPSIFLAVFIAIYVGQTLSSVWLEFLNNSHAKRFGGEVPPGFESAVDRARLESAKNYGLAGSRLSIIEKLTSDSALLLFILSGFMPHMERLLVHAGIPWLISGLLFILIPGFIITMLELPFDYYRALILEERFGFNRSTPAQWAIDEIKKATLSVVISSTILLAVLWTIRRWPDIWWILAFLLVSVVQLLMVVLYPVLIAPLFNKFEPLKDETLARDIQDLVSANGMPVEKVLQMDAGKRSSHTNAYFAGIGKTRKVVLYDTLLASHTRDEIMAVLAHEIGHYKKRHIIKQVVLLEILMFSGFYLTHVLLSRPEIYQAFGLYTREAWAGIFFIGIFIQKAGFFVQPILMAVSRLFEREADDYAVKLTGTGVPLASALKRMATDNLSNLFPHPFYVRFHYSHPPLGERIRRLESWS